MKKSLLSSAAALLLLCAVVSCGEAAEAPKPEGGVNSEAVITPETEAVTKAVDSIGSLSELDFGGQKLTVNISVNEEEWNTSAVYIMGAEEEVGDEAKDLVYRRNLEIAEALNVSVDWITADEPYTEVLNYIKKPVLAGDSTVDLYINDQYGLVRCMTAGCLYNVSDIPAENNYFDFSADGWYTEYMDQLSILDGRRYFLAGDYFMDILRGTHVMYFNKNLMANLYEGADDLYDVVFSGQWTYDKLIGYVKDCYRDLNGNGAVDAQDLFGVRAHPAWGNLYLNTTDCRTVSYDKDGNLYIDPSVDRFSSLADRLITIYTSVGHCELKSDEGTSARIGYFINGQVLFTIWLKIADMEADEMRNMDGIGLIPYPKLDESQDTYRTLVHDIAELGAVPATVNEKNLPALSAYLQAMTRYSAQYLMPQYFETALKIKYSQDEQFAQMLDIIRDGIRCPFEYAYSEYFSSIGYKPLSDSISKKSNVIASTIEKGMKSAEKQLTKLMDALNALE